MTLYHRQCADGDVAPQLRQLTGAVPPEVPAVQPVQAAGRKTLSPASVSFISFFLGMCRQAFA